MARIDGVDPTTTDGYIANVFAAQTKNWGSPLLNHRVYARRPALFKAVRGMWTSLDKDGRLGDALVGLVNRRVASLNGCDF